MGTLNCKKLGFCMRELLCKAVPKFALQIVCMGVSDPEDPT